MIIFKTFNVYSAFSMIKITEKRSHKLNTITSPTKNTMFSNKEKTKN